MSSTPIPPGQREFRCHHCQGRILVPVTLPPTTGPCPHCSQTITSPGPENPAPTLVAAAPPAPPAAPAPVAAPPPVEPAQKPSPEPAGKTPKNKKAKAANSPKAASKPPSRAGLLISCALLIPAILGGGLWLMLKKMHATPDTPPFSLTAPGPEQAALLEQQYLESGWETEAREVLARFLAADTPNGKAAYSIRGGELLGEMQAFYGHAPIDDSDTPVNAFSSFRLTLEDRKRGIFMMTYDLPPSFEMAQFFSPIVPLRVQYHLEEQGMLIEELSRTANFVTEPMLVHALFKRTPEGLRVDWETFVQTKYRRMRDFIELPEAGRKGVFRVIISETVPQNRAVPAGHRVYLISDPAHRAEDSTRINVPVDTDIGRALSILNWRGTNGGRATARTATVELRWSNHEVPQIELSRFLCWEFLGVGGEAVKTTAASAPSPADVGP